MSERRHDEMDYDLMDALFGAGAMEPENYLKSNEELRQEEEQPADFSDCQDFAELNAAYEQAVAAVKSSQSFEQAMNDLTAGCTPAEDDRIPQWDAIKDAMHKRWSELSGEPWPGDDHVPAASDPSWYEDSDRPDMEQ